MEVLTKRITDNASCSFCERDVSEVKFLFAQGVGTMCPDCVKEVRALMREDLEEEKKDD